MPLLLANWASSPLQRILIGFRLGNPCSRVGNEADLAICSASSVGSSYYSFPSLQAQAWKSLLLCGEHPHSCPVLRSSCSSQSQTHLLFEWQHMPSHSQSQLKYKFCLFLPTIYSLLPQAFKIWASHWCTNVKIPAKGSIHQVEVSACVCTPLFMCNHEGVEQTVLQCLCLPKCSQSLKVMQYRGNSLDCRKERNPAESYRHIVKISISSVTSLDLDCKKSVSVLHDRSLHSTGTNTQLCFPQCESLHAFAANIYCLFDIGFHVFCQNSFSKYTHTIHLNSLVTA